MKRAEVLTMATTFYTNPNSRGRMVRWMLEEIGCTYDVVILDYQSASGADRWGGAALEVPVHTSADDPHAVFFSRREPDGKSPRAGAQRADHNRNCCHLCLSG
ncbi:hypothetical protein EMIT0347P_80200 [Pseudomonas sp. IT-347P]